MIDLTEITIRCIVMKKLEMEREKLVHFPRNQRRSVTSVANGTKENVLARTKTQAIVCMKTTSTLSVTGTTIITGNSVSGCLDYCYKICNYCKKKGQIKRNCFKWKADNPAGKGQENTVKQELAFVTCDSPIVEVLYED